MVRAWLGFICVLCATPLWAAVSEQQAARLEQDLTPLGGERAGNPAGTIPPWTGGLATPPPGYIGGMHHLDPYANDAELYRVSKDNLGEYRPLLARGLQVYLQQNPQAFLRVFPTRRSAAVPLRIYDETRKNASSAVMVNGGNGVENAAAGIPFPLPTNGLEVIWNHILRYRGDQVQMATNQAAVMADGRYSLLKMDRSVYFVYGRNGMTTQNLNNNLLYYKYRIAQPERLAGSAMVVQESLNQIERTRRVWRFSRGERRAHAVPMLSYDSLQPDTNGMATADLVDAYNGAPNRYQWRLLGKREMLVPYNSYRVHQQGIPYSEILQQRSLNPELLRYELHRVWVVEATLKSGLTHAYGKRVFYLDEDSWQILLVDLYDRDGRLIGLQESHPISYYEVPMFGSTLEVLYDLQKRRYFVDGLDNNESMYDFNAPLAPRDFTPEALRAEGR